MRHPPHADEARRVINLEEDAPVAARHPVARQAARKLLHAPGPGIPGQIKDDFAQPLARHLADLLEVPLSRWLKEDAVSRGQRDVLALERPK